MIQPKKKNTTGEVGKETVNSKPLESKRTQSREAEGYVSKDGSEEVREHLRELLSGTKPSRTVKKTARVIGGMDYSHCRGSTRLRRQNNSRKKGTEKKLSSHTFLGGN